MKAVLSGLLWFQLDDLNENIIEKIKEAYSYPHPFEDNVFKTYIEHNGRLGVPFGNKDKIKDIVGGFDIEDKRIAPLCNKPFSFLLSLRDYQKETVDEIFEYINNGGTEFNLAGFPSSGKSITLADILSKLNVKTLIVAHMSMLTEQLYKEVKENTTADVAILSAKSKELTDINIATSQFISQNPDIWKQIKHNIGCIVVDEAESLMSLTTLRIVQRAHAKYKIFISATYERPIDGRTDGLIDFSGRAKFVLDNKAYNIPAKVMMVECPEVFPKFRDKFSYIRNKNKFFTQYSILEKVIFLTEKSLEKGRQVLIAADIIKLQDTLADMLQEYGVGVLNSNTKKKDREQILEDYDKGAIKVLIAAQVVNAGLSIPKISTIVRVSFPSSETKSVQLVGRAQRPLAGKEAAYVFDLVFQNQNPYKRIKKYKENNFEVTRHLWMNVKAKLEGA